MMDISYQNFTLYRGDTHLFKVVLSSDGNPLDLTRAVLYMDVVAGDGSIIRPEITVDGNAVFLLFPAVLTRDLNWSRAEYDLRVAVGNVVKTYLRGMIEIKPNVSNVAAELSGEMPKVETVEVDVSGQAIIVQAVAAKATDTELIDGLKAKIQQLEADVLAADESEEIQALSERLAIAQTAIASASSLEGRLKTLENNQAAISEQTVELAKQRAALQQALDKMVQNDAAVAALESRLEILKIQFEAAEESSEIETLNQRIFDVTAELAEAKQAAAAAEESEELVALQAKIKELESLSATQIQTASEIAEIRNLLGLRKCEKIHLTQNMWADGGYTWVKAVFQNTYKDPKIYLSLEHTSMVVLFLNHNFGAKTGNSVLIRSNFDKSKIDVSYSVYLYVEEWQDSINP